MPETLDIDDRAGFYDETGATLDMVVTHLFQVAAEIAMEPPRRWAGRPARARESVIAASARWTRTRSSSASTTATAT